MANYAEEKFGNIFKLLSQHNFQLNVTDKFKCTKCKHILINACATTCGCKYCRECVDKMLTSGCEKCSGNNKNCKSENLSNIVPDHVMNMRISKLLVKCPEQMCGHECQLIHMEEHMRLCSKKPIQCPCHDLGCNDENLVADKLNEHLQTKSFNHWTMLMGLIGDLRNEVAQLKKTENVNKIEIGLLREEGRAKDKKIEEMRTEMTYKIRKCEAETEMLRRQIITVKDNLDCKNKSMSDEINEKIDSMKKQKTELSGELANLKGKFEGIRVEEFARLEETRRGSMGQVKERMTARMDEMKICLDGKIDGTRFVWPVGKISKITNVYPGRLSEYFKINPYKIQLGMANSNSHLEIWLSIHPGPNDEKLQWPFQAKVWVKVTNKATLAVCLKDTKYCNLPRPPKDSYSHNSKDPFKFPLADLSSKNLLLGDCCIVECFVNLQ